MSQHPSPYQSPQPQQNPYYGYGSPQTDLLGPGQRAAVLMWIFAALFALGGFCCAGVGAMLPQLLQQQPDLLRDMQLPPDITPEHVQLGFVIVGVFILIVSLLLGLVAIWVRKSQLWAVVIGIILSSLLLLGVLGNLLLGLSAMLADPARGAIGLLMNLGLILLLGLQLVWLVQAARNAGRLRDLQAQYAAQWYQYQQNLYAYQQQQQQQQQQPRPPETPPGG